MTTWPRRAGQAGERRELREGVGGEPVRLEPVLGLARHHLERLLLDQRDGVELRVEAPRDRVGLRERLAHQRERGREPDVPPDRRPLQVGECLTRLDRRERAVVEARQLAPDVLHEARLVGAASW